MGGIVSGVVGLSVGVNLDRAGLVGYSYQHGEVTGLHLAGPLARVLSNVQTAVIIDASLSLLRAWLPPLTRL